MKKKFETENEYNYRLREMIDDETEYENGGTENIKTAEQIKIENKLKFRYYPKLYISDDDEIVFELFCGETTKDEKEAIDLSSFCERWISEALQCICGNEVAKIEYFWDNEKNYDYPQQQWQDDEFICCAKTKKLILENIANWGKSRCISKITFIDDPNEIDSSDAIINLIKKYMPKSTYIYGVTMVQLLESEEK